MSSKCLSRLGGAEEVTAFLETVTKATGTTCIIHPESGTQVLVGDINSIIKTQKMIFQRVTGFELMDSSDATINKDENVNTPSNLAEKEGSLHVDGCHGDGDSISANNEKNETTLDDEPKAVDQHKETSLNCQNTCKTSNNSSLKQTSKPNTQTPPTDSTVPVSNRRLRSCQKLSLNDESMKNPDKNCNTRQSRRYSTRNKQVDFSELAGFKKKVLNEVVSRKMPGKKWKNSTINHDNSDTSSAVGRPSSSLAHSKVTEKKGKKISVGINTDYDSTDMEEGDKTVENEAVTEREADNTLGQEVVANSKNVVKFPKENGDTTKYGDKYMDVEESLDQQPEVMPDVRIPTVKFLFEVKNNKCKKLKPTLPNQAEEKKEGADVIQAVDPRDTKQRNLNCKNCDFISDTFAKLTSHLLSTHKDVETFRCDICERIFSQKSYLDRHLNLKHGPFNKESSCRCTLCGTELDSEAILNWHMSKFHGQRKGKKSKKRMKTCSQCPFQTNLAMVMRHHRLTVHDEVPQCEFCGRRFAKVTLLRSHIQTVHTKEKSCVCHICGKDFSHVRYLHSHLRRHTGVKNHACTICDFRFYDGNALKDHMETHKDKAERTYKFCCSYCGKGFRNKSNFVDHLNKHTGNKPYQCGLCGRCFGFRSELGKHHMFIHSTDKPFKCSLCEKAFKLKRLRDNHMTIHNGRSAFVCNSCHRPFSCKATLKVHETKCHKIILNPSMQERTDVFSNDASSAAEMRTQKIALQSLVQNGTDIMPVQNIVISLPDGTEIPALEPEKIELYSDVVEVAELVNEVNQTEVYLCSECNATFDSYGLAEQHMLLCHMEPPMEVEQSERPATDTLTNETVGSVNTIITTDSIISINALEESGV